MGDEIFDWARFCRRGVYLELLPCGRSQRFNPNGDISE